MKRNNFFDDLLDLFYPRICAVCGTSLLKGEEAICSRCIYDMPRTRFHHDMDNEVSQLFWGRVKINHATSFFYYKKGSKYQQCIHQLKYRSNLAIGEKMGEMFGNELLSSPFCNVEVIVPLPLHKRKEKIRGFNQSEIIARGVANVMQKPVLENAVERVLYTDSQTRRSRYERWQNVEKIFNVKNPCPLESKKILLLDDVVTTGSTLEACANELLKVPGIEIHIATLAVAKM